MGQVRIIGHAGAAGLAPENTLAAIRAALAHGAGGVEVDVRATADGVPVLLHDETVDRTTDGTGRIDTLPFATARHLDAARLWRGRAACYEPLPGVASVLREVAGRALVCLEVKPAGIEEAVVRAVIEAGALSWAEVHSFLPEVIAAARSIEPRLTTALVAGDERPAGPVEAALRLGANGLSLAHRRALAEPALLARARDAGLRVYAWTVDDADTARRLIDLGVEAIITNRPDLMPHE